MPLLEMIIALIVVGVLLYLVNRFVPMAPSIKTILNWVVIICVIVFVLVQFGVLDYLRAIQVPRV